MGGGMDGSEEELEGYIDYKLSHLIGKCRGNTHLDSERGRERGGEGEREGGGRETEGERVGG